MQRVEKLLKLLISLNECRKRFVNAKTDCLHFREDLPCIVGIGAASVEPLLFRRNGVSSRGLREGRIDTSQLAFVSADFRMNFTEPLARGFVTGMRGEADPGSLGGQIVCPLLCTGALALK